MTAGYDGANISEGGLTQWSGMASVVSVYFYLHQPEELTLLLNARGRSVISVTLDGKKKQVKLSSDQFSDIPIGKMSVKTPGYVRIDITGVKKSGEHFGEISALILGGLKGKASYVKAIVR